MCIHGKFMSTQIITVNFHFLVLFWAFFTFTFCHSDPCSMVRLACALEWLSAIQVAVHDPGIVLYSLSYTEVLNLGLTSVSSDISLSVRDLL